jgi:hypothetical protein
MKTIVEPVAARTATTALIAVPPLPQHVELIGARTAQTALIGVPPLPQCEVSVIIPAKDEAQTIAATLTALANQTDLNGQPLNPLTYEIIVLANNCTDESATIAR